MRVCGRRIYWQRLLVLRLSKLHPFGDNWVAPSAYLIPCLGLSRFVGDDLLAVRLSHIGSYLFSKNTQLLGEWVEDEFALVDVGVLLLAVFGHDELLISRW